MKRVFPGGLFLLFFAFGPPAAAEIPLRGRVFAEGRALAGAVVRLTAVPSLAEDLELRFSGAEPAEQARALSGADGAFALAGPAEGFYRVTVTAEGWLSAETFVFLDPLRPPAPEIRLLPARRVSLAVSGPDGPVAGARVRRTFHPQLPLINFPAFTATGADGKAILELGRDLDGELWVVADGFLPQAIPFPVSGPGAARILLAPAPPVAIAVVDAARGRPLAGVAVLLTGSGLALGRTGADGKVAVRIPPGEKELGLAGPAGHRGRKLLAQGPPADGAPLRIELEEPLQLRGQVVELPARTPLEGAWLDAAGRLPLFTRSGRDGAFELTVPRQWAPFLKARKSGYRSAGTTMPERPAPLNLGLAGAARLAGRVLDPAGAPVAEAEVSLWIAGVKVPGSVDHAASDAAGRFVFEEASAGEELEIAARTPNGRESPPLRVAALEAGRGAEVELRLPARESLAVRIVGKDGAGIAGAELIAVPGGGRRGLRWADVSSWEKVKEGRPLAVADASGLAVLGLAAGHYDLAARAPGFAPRIEPGVKVAPATGETPPPRELTLEPAVTLAGKVVDAAGKGVAGAELRLRLVGPRPEETFLSRELPPVIARSGDDGRFSFQAIAANQLFDLIAQRRDYAATILAAMVASPAEPLLVELKAAGRIAGTVRGRGRPVAGVVVQADLADPRERMLRWADGLRATARTDARGAYLLEGLTPGRYLLAASGSPGLQSFRSPLFEVAAGESLKQDIELAAAALVFGRILLPNGEPARGARIVFSSGDEGRPMPGDFAMADQLGGYRLESVKPGKGRFEVEAAGFRPLEKPVTIEEGENQIDLTLEAGAASLAGRVLGPDGEPIAGARVGLLVMNALARGEAVPIQLESRADGAALFEALEEGEYLLNIAKAGYDFTPVKIAVAAGANQLEWRLGRAGARLRGAILGLEAGERADLWVRAISAFGAGTDGHLEGDGYVVERLPVGRFTVLATSARSGIVLAKEAEIAEGQPEVTQDLDFRALAGPYKAEIRRGGKPLEGLRYNLIGLATPFLIDGTSSDGRLEIRAPSGRYRLSLMLPPGQFRNLEIELGEPSEQVIDVESLPAAAPGPPPPPRQ